MTTTQFAFGDRIIHTGRPEWGEGVVTAAQPATQDGKPCQRVTVRFDRVGIKTLSTALAPLQRKDATHEIHAALANAREGEWLSEVGSKQVQEIMTRLPERAVDPFASLESRLKATLELFRFAPTGGALIDWAAAQTGLKDPLARFNRHDLEEFFTRFAIARDQHLKRLLAEGKKQDPQMVARVTSAAPREAQLVVRRLDARG